MIDVHTTWSPVSEETIWPPRDLPVCAQRGCGLRIRANGDGFVFEHRDADGQVTGVWLFGDEVADVEVDLWGDIARPFIDRQHAGEPT